MASHNDGSQSEEQNEDLEDLIRQSEAAIESVTELIQELAGVDWEYRDVSSGPDQLSQYKTENVEEHRESGIFELTEVGDKEQLKVKSELNKEEMESEFHDLLSSLILELNHIKADVTENIPAQENKLQPDEMELYEAEEKITRSTENFASDAATQTEIKKKSLKCTIL